MAFDFPDSPAIDDEYVSGGATYIYTAQGVWDLGSSATMTDYVLKAGDTMTGALRITDAAAAPLSLGGLNKRIIQFDNCWIAQRNGAHGQEGMLQIWTNNGGYSDAICLETTIQSGAAGIRTPGRSFFGGVTVSGANVSMGDGAGIHWGNTSAVASVTDFTEGICLYGWGTTSKFGLCITSGTLNLTVENTANLIAFNVGTEQVMNVKTDGVRIPGGNLSVTGNISATGTISSSVAANGTGLQFGDGVKIDLSSGCQMRKVYGSNQFQFHTNASQVFAFHISNTGDVFIIDTIGSTGNSVSVTAPEAIATAQSLGVEPVEERGVDVMVVMAAMLAKIQLLESEIADLKGTR